MITLNEGNSCLNCSTSPIVSQFNSQNLTFDEQGKLNEHMIYIFFNHFQAQSQIRVLHKAFQNIKAFKGSYCNFDAI